MKRLLLIYGLLCFFAIYGCAYGPSSILKPEKHDENALPDKIKSEDAKLSLIQKDLRTSLEKKTQRKIEIEPVMPVYNPLEDKIVSFSMVNEKLEIILYSLAHATGLNLIIDPAVKNEEKLLTLNFEEVSAAIVLREILSSFDYYYEIEENIIRVKPFQERFFKLNFLDTSVKSSFDVGGDVLGAGETETVSGLSGSFKLSGNGTKFGNPYDMIETMFKPLISRNGKITLNRLSGSLYIKDKPSVILMVSRLIKHFKEMLSRQIIIEARIIEVALSDEYKYGIDWNLLKDLSNAASELGSASWSYGTGLLLKGSAGDYSLSTTINALNTFGDTKVVSNPSIRSKHGKPAMISVGTSYTYKKSVETTTTSTSSESNTTTEVEVSTVFDGLILGVIPFIEESGKISLQINPIKSDVDQSSLNPESVSTGQSISLPIVHVKEISTTIAMRSHDVVILGGLIDKRLVKVNKGVPFLSAIPVLGYLFKNEYKREETRELVIILSVSLI